MGYERFILLLLSLILNLLSCYCKNANILRTNNKFGGCLDINDKMPVCNVTWMHPFLRLQYLVGLCSEERLH